jgi:hypothetical protein
MRRPPGCLDQLFSDHLEIRIVCHGSQFAGHSRTLCIANYGIQCNGELARGYTIIGAISGRSPDAADLITIRHTWEAHERGAGS